MKKSPKLLIISQALAPSVGGSPILMNNLFSSYQGEVYAISGYPGARIDKDFKPAFQTKYFNPPKIPIIGKYIERYHDNILKYVHPILIKRMVHEIRKYNPDIVFSHCPDIDYFICAYQAAVLCKVPFYSHMHDLWEENHGPDTYIGKMAIRWEKEIFSNSTRVFCMTSVQQDHYYKKYKIKTDLLPHTIPDKILDETLAVFNDTTDNSLLFTGTVSKVMNLDSLRVLSDATSELKKHMKIILCTSATHNEFNTWNIKSNDWEIKWMSRNEVQALQKQSAILFAPLSCKNGGMDEIRTVFSTKILEYLISGRPILVFAPKGSFHEISATDGNWGLVVNEDNPDKLIKEALRLLNDKGLQKQLVEGAFREAQNRRSSIYSNKLMEWIGEDIQQRN
ncbi:MAG: glycosyltransferase [Bacteroidota bacterium]